MRWTWFGWYKPPDNTVWMKDMGNSIGARQFIYSRRLDYSLHQVHILKYYYFTFYVQNFFQL